MEKILKEKIKLARAYKEFFSSSYGKTVLEDLMRECHFISHTMSKDSHETAFNEGKRNVFLYIFRNINVDLDQMLKLIESRQSQGEENE